MRIDQDARANDDTDRLETETNLQAAPAAEENPPPVGTHEGSAVSSVDDVGALEADDD